MVRQSAVTFEPMQWFDFKILQDLESPKPVLHRLFQDSLNYLYRLCVGHPQREDGDKHQNGQILRLDRPRAKSVKIKGNSELRSKFMLFCQTINYHKFFVLLSFGQLCFKSEQFSVYKCSVVQLYKLKCSIVKEVVVYCLVVYINIFRVG